MIIPSIDIMDGRVVQLRRGRELILTDERSPREVAEYFGRFGAVAVVDLDAALGQGENRDLVTQCCQVARCRVGGGIRSADDVRYWIKQGAEKVVIGTLARSEFLEQFPRDWIVVALDADNDNIVVDGWRTRTGASVADTARLLEPYCSGFLFTQVEREGTLCGVDEARAKSLRDALSVPITIAGGVAEMGDVTNLIELGVNVQIGRALYERRIDLIDTWIKQLRFDSRGLIPTVVQDANTMDVLMLAYSNRESLTYALTRGEGSYYSRSRRELWRKGETSGNTQRLVSASWDCDRDTVLFLVEQTGAACHLEQATCFGDRRHNVLHDLKCTIQKRQQTSAAGSYTRALLSEPTRVAAKLREEIEEVIEAKSPAEIAWEAADVLYHLMVRLAAGDVPFERVLRELRSRVR